jgi:hypothetical protein
MTGLAIRPVPLPDREELLALVEAGLGALEEGLTPVARRVPAGRVAVDLAALDARGRLVLCLLGPGSEPALLLAAVEAYAWCRENPALLPRLFPAAGLDPGLPPRVFLLAARFSDEVLRAARYLGEAAPALVECRCLEVDGTRGICLEPLADPLAGAAAHAAPDFGPPAAAGDPARERARRLVRHLERLPFREAFAGAPAAVPATRS